MNPLIEVLLTGVVAGLAGTTASYLLSLRKDREARRRELIISHLIEAYKELEDVANRDVHSEDKRKRFEASIAAINLLGRKSSVNAASVFTEAFASGNSGDITPLLLSLRNDLRKELGLEDLGNEIRFFRMTKGASSK